MNDIKLKKGDSFYDNSPLTPAKWHIMEVFKNEPRVQFAVKRFSKNKRRWMYEIKSETEVNMFFKEQIYSFSRTK
jgi:hypothetical protein